LGIRRGALQATATIDQGAFTALFDEHFAYVWRSLARLGVPVHEAEDLAQEVFVVVHRRLAGLDPARSPRPWLFGVAYNVVREHRRRARSRPEDLAFDDLPDVGRSDPGYGALEAADLVHAALRRVPEARRAVLVLVDLDGVTMREAAQVLGIPVDTGYARLRVARVELAGAVRALTERGAR
jgi:RNA polymerase sigma-70 factor (ECF subfamily)